VAKLARFFVADGVPGPGRLRLEGDAAVHLGRVLRARAGQDIVLFDGRGGEYPARVVTAARKFVEVDVGPREDLERESPVPITLLQGLCRGERMDLVVRKATELGVARIRPVLAERSVVKLDDRREESRLAHWEAIVVSACEQCGRNRLTGILPPMGLAEALRAHADAAGVLLDPSAAIGPAGLALPGSAGLALLVGPEGGLTENEREAALATGFRAVRLGPRVLRTETAAITGLALLQAAFGDLG
jgi:16S rRNA (uracil1498-N3)-methyltransferase